MSADEQRILNTMGKFALYLGNHNSICIGVSGGSDSDIIVHIVSTYFREFLPKVHFVFVNTGLEYKATRDHLDFLEQKYQIKIDRIRGMSVVTAVRRYGIPIVSKEHSQKIAGFIRGAPCATLCVMGEAGTRKFYFSPKCKKMAIAIKDRNIRVANMCCQKSKKDPLAKYQKDHGIDLSVTGERRAEGGSRATSHKTCFEPSTSHGYDKYMPLFFWDDDTKSWYKDHEGITYSDCYEVWGMKRTGCVGCPFNSKIGRELDVIKKYEPKMYKACINVFGESYRLMDEFNIRREKILGERYEQISLFDNEEDPSNEEQSDED